MLFVVCNRSSVVTTSDVQRMFEAIDQACVIFCGEWGFRCPQFLLDDGGPSDPLAIKLVIVDTDPTRVDELGDHSENEDGHPDVTILAKVVTDAGGGILNGGKIGVSVASVVCHEIFEVLCDIFVNDWIFDGRNFLAKESADPVEGAPGYPVVIEDGTTVHVSNGVLPRYFDPLAPEGSRFDLAEAVSFPFQLLPGGYQVIFDVSTAEVREVYGRKRQPVLETLRRKLKDTRRGRRKAKIHAARQRLLPPAHRDEARATLPALPEGEHEAVDSFVKIT